jgi:hypothetical protein
MAFGFSCPMIAREFNSTKGLNLGAVFWTWFTILSTDGN